MSTIRADQPGDYAPTVGEMLMFTLNSSAESGVYPEGAKSAPGPRVHVVVVTEEHVFLIYVPLDGEGRR